MKKLRGTTDKCNEEAQRQYKNIVDGAVWHYKTWLIRSFSDGTGSRVG
jgi:hypothetical protein